MIAIVFGAGIGIAAISAVLAVLLPLQLGMTPRPSTLVEERKAAQEAFEVALLERGILQFLREHLAWQLESSYSLELHVVSDAGLRETPDVFSRSSGIAVRVTGPLCTEPLYRSEGV